MDNQQATQTFMLGYLGAAIDAEGTIGIYKGDRNGNYKPVLKIFNTDKKFIDYLSSILKINKIAHYVYISNPKRAKVKYKECFAIVISGYKRLANSLDFFIPLLVIKRKQAELLKAIIVSRRSNKMTFQNQMRPYTLSELRMIDEIRQLNKRGKGMRVLND